MIIVHARIMIIILAYNMIIIHACNMFTAHVSCPMNFMFDELEGCGCRGRKPPGPGKQGCLGATGIPLIIVQACLPSQFHGRRDVAVLSYQGAVEICLCLPFTISFALRPILISHNFSEWNGVELSGVECNAVSCGVMDWSVVQCSYTVI